MTNTRIFLTRPDGRSSVASVNMTTDAEIMAEALAAQLPEWSFLSIVYPKGAYRGDRVIVGTVKGMLPPEPTEGGDDPLAAEYPNFDVAWLKNELARIRKAMIAEPTAYRVRVYATIAREIARRS